MRTWSAAITVLIVFGVVASIAFTYKGTFVEKDFLVVNTGPVK